MLETMKLFGSKKNQQIKQKLGKFFSKSWSSLVQCNLRDNKYQQKSEVLYTFIP